MASPSNNNLWAENPDDNDTISTTQNFHRDARRMANGADEYTVFLLPSGWQLVSTACPSVIQVLHPMTAADSLLATYFLIYCQ